MTTARAPMIYWGGETIQSEFGSTFININTRVVNFNEEFDFEGLQNNIRTTLGLNDVVIIYLNI